jgi:hypothetical protein
LRLAGGKSTSSELTRTEPDYLEVEEHKQVSGSAGLTGVELLKYCLWHQGLSAYEKKESDALLV